MLPACYKSYRGRMYRSGKRPTLSQDAVHYWWSPAGTKKARELLAILIIPVDVTNGGGVEWYLENEARRYKDKLLSSPLPRSRGMARQWGKYCRMLELHKVRKET